MVGETGVLFYSPWLLAHHFPNDIQTVNLKLDEKGFVSNFSKKYSLELMKYQGNCIYIRSVTGSLCGIALQSRDSCIPIDNYLKASGIGKIELNPRLSIGSPNIYFILSPYYIGRTNYINWNEDRPIHLILI